MSNIAPINPGIPTSSLPTQPTEQVSPPQSIKSPQQKIERRDPTKKKTKWSYIIGGIILLMLIIGGGAGYWLTQQS